MIGSTGSHAVDGMLEDARGTTGLDDFRGYCERFAVAPERVRLTGVAPPA
jgi:hypothetical protein